MVQNVSSGALSYCNYGFEAAWGTDPAAYPRPFGQGVKLTISRKNNMDRIFGLGARNASANVAKKYEGTASIEFMLGAGEAAIADGGASWFRAVLGAIPVDAGGADPYTHTYTESNTLTSFSIANGVELGANDYVSVLIGCKVQSCNITAAVDEVAKVRLECPYKTETLAIAGISSQVVPTEVPLTFAQGTLSVAGVTVGYVQSVDLTITNNVEMVYGLGSRYAAGSPAKTRTYDLKMGVKFYEVAKLLEKFFGKAAPIASTDLAVLNPAGVACVLSFSNGVVGAGKRAIDLTFANLQLNEHSLPLNVDEVIQEDVTGWALSCTSIVVTNGQATDVAQP